MKRLFTIWQMMRSYKWVAVCIKSETDAEILTSSEVTYKDLLKVASSMYGVVSDHDAECNALKEVNEILGNK